MTTALHWPLLERLPQRLAGDAVSPPLYRDCLREAHAELAARFHAEEPIEAIVHARAQLIDVVLRAAWRAHLGEDADRWALVAVGGYGRGELQPCSDIDVLVLTPEPLTADGRGPVARLPEAEVARIGTASESYVSVRALLYMLAGHVIHHIVSLKTDYKISG